MHCIIGLKNCILSIATSFSKTTPCLYCHLQLTAFQKPQKQLLALEKEYTDKEYQALQDQKKTRAETMQVCRLSTKCCWVFRLRFFGSFICFFFLHRFQLLDANHQKALQIIKLRHEKEEKEMRQQHETERIQLTQMSHGK